MALASGRQLFLFFFHVFYSAGKDFNTRMDKIHERKIKTAVSHLPEPCWYFTLILSNTMNLQGATYIFHFIGEEAKVQSN